MNLAINKAKEVAISFVTVRNSNHYGIAGFYTKMACDNGLIGISTTNSESIGVHLIITFVKKGQGAGTCLSFIVIDPKIFGDTQDLINHLSVFLKELRDVKRADENVPIYTHGEKEALIV